jgi:hypothetical protein
MARQVDSQRIGDRRGQRNRPEAGGRLRWSELGHLVTGADELPVNTDFTPKEVDSVDGEAKSLALAEACASGDNDQRSVPPWHGENDLFDRFDREWNDLVSVLLGQGNPLARRGRDETVGNGRPEDRRHPVGELDGPGRQNVRPVLDPDLDVATADGAELTSPECRVGVHSEVRLQLRGGRPPMELAGPPRLGVVLEQPATAVRVDVDAAGEVASSRNSSAHASG